MISETFKIFTYRSWNNKVKKSAELKGKVILERESYFDNDLLMVGLLSIVQEILDETDGVRGVTNTEISKHLLHWIRIWRFLARS